jgi:hypothetical protein
VFTNHIKCKSSNNFNDLILILILSFTQWFTEATWFDGYAWKICLCPTCKSHIGWMFEPIELAYNNPIFPSDKGFYAIVVDSVISESCKLFDTTLNLLNLNLKFLVYSTQMSTRC